VPYAALFDGGVPPHAVDLSTIGEFLRCSMGLSAWKQHGASRWALRVNPSSGNLHPTEAYIVWNGRVQHYAPREHALEERAVVAGRPLDVARGRPGDEWFLVALTSIHWREAWKYGERAFRYCQHDAGHAIAALRIAAAMLGWTLTLLPRWSHAQMAALLGTERDGDYGGAEREEPECVAVVTAGDPGAWLDRDPEPLAHAARAAAWRGTANQLSPDHMPWPIIDEVATATRFHGGPIRVRPTGPMLPVGRTVSGPPPPLPGPPDARSVILQRRSALAFDARSGLRRDAFVGMLRRLRPVGSPWDAIDWPPQVHLALFVHRVADLTPGLYVYLRDPAVAPDWKAAMRPDFLWEEVDEGLFVLVPIDCRRAANRVSCDQDIAEDGFFSLGMIARFDAALEQYGEWMYRRLFWETGMVGQVLYLEAEAVGARATGIGCFYDDPVHELFGLQGRAWQSLYHFSMGVPVEDTRLTSEPGYAWERPDPSTSGSRAGD
jgi:SagB-type dehydrogenase family enzyme